MTDSGVTVEILDQNIQSLVEQTKDANLVNWENITSSQQSLIKGFEACMNSLMGLRENLQKGYLWTLRDLKSIDAKDLLAKRADNKAEPGTLKGLVEYSTLVDGKVTIDQARLKHDALQKEKKFTELNQDVTRKLFETAQWIDEFIRKELQVSKTKTSQSTDNKSQLQQVEKKNESAQEAQFSKFQFSEEKLNKIAAKIKVEYIKDSKLIGMDTYEQIVNYSIELAEGEYARLVFENRKERRENMQKFDQYMKLVQEHMVDQENLFIKAQEDICKKIGITNEVLEKSELTLMERGLGNRMLLLQTQVREKIKEKLPKKNSVEVKTTREIIEFQTTLLNEKQDQLLPFIKDLPRNYETSQQLPILLNYIVNDFVAEQYNIEEEDYMHHLEDDTFDQKQMGEMLKKIEEGVIQLLQKLGFNQIPQYGGIPMMPMGYPGMPMGYPGMPMGYPPNFPGF